jgi:hypothetical protein
LLLSGPPRGTPEHLPEHLAPPGGERPPLALRADDECRRQEPAGDAIEPAGRELGQKRAAMRIVEHPPGKVQRRDNRKRQATALADPSQPLDVDRARSPSRTLKNVDDVLQPVELVACRTVRTGHEEEGGRRRFVAATGLEHVLVAQRKIAAQIWIVHEIAVDFDHHVLGGMQDPLVLEVVGAFAIIHVVKLEAV